MLLSLFAKYYGNEIFFTAQGRFFYVVAPLTNVQMHMKKNAAKNRNRFRGVSLLLVCVALGVVLFVGYPVMMPHIAIVSFTIHQCLCPILDPLSFSRLCLSLFIKLPLANFLFEIQFENSIACKCALCLRCCPKTCSCAFAKKKNDQR